MVRGGVAAVATSWFGPGLLGQRVVHAFEHGHGLAVLEGFDQLPLRERTEGRDIDGADLLALADTG